VPASSEFGDPANDRRSRARWLSSVGSESPRGTVAVDGRWRSARPNTRAPTFSPDRVHRWRQDPASKRTHRPLPRCQTAVESRVGHLNPLRPVLRPRARWACRRPRVRDTAGGTAVCWSESRDFASQRPALSGTSGQRKIAAVSGRRGRARQADPAPSESTRTFGRAEGGVCGTRGQANAPKSGQLGIHPERSARLLSHRRRGPRRGRQPVRLHPPTLLTRLPRQRGSDVRVVK
jgi:hypothetical protein